MKEGASTRSGVSDMDNAKRSRLTVAFLRLIDTSQEVLSAVSDLRGEPVDDDMLNCMARLYRLLAPGQELQPHAGHGQTVALFEAAIAQLTVDLGETILPVASNELARVQPQLTSPRAKLLAPYLRLLAEVNTLTDL